MIAFVKRLWAAAPVATVILALALTGTVLFGARTAMFWVHRHERIAREQPVAAWMTPGFVAHSWHLPREVVIETLSLDPQARPPRETLAELAQRRGVPVETLITALEAAIAAQSAADPGAGGNGAAPGVEGSDQPAPGDTPLKEPAPDEGPAQ